MAKAKPKKKGAQKTPLRMPAPPKKKPAPKKKPTAKKPAPKKAQPKKPAPKPKPKPKPAPAKKTRAKPKAKPAPKPPAVIEKPKEYRTICWVKLGGKSIPPGTVLPSLPDNEIELLLKQQAIEEVK
jgi:hypothetical protein